MISLREPCASFMRSPIGQNRSLRPKNIRPSPWASAAPPFCECYSSHPEPILKDLVLPILGPALGKKERSDAPRSCISKLAFFLYTNVGPTHLCTCMLRLLRFASGSCKTLIHLVRCHNRGFGEFPTSCSLEMLTTSVLFLTLPS